LATFWMQSINSGGFYGFIHSSIGKNSRECFQIANDANLAGENS
ncbi:MAG: hypothetical protein ACI932_000833, partial [Paracoccaceae bacterium]